MWDQAKPPVYTYDDIINEIEVMCDFDLSLER